MKNAIALMSLSLLLNVSSAMAETYFCTGKPTHLTNQFTLEKNGLNWLYVRDISDLAPNLQERGMVVPDGGMKKSTYVGIFSQYFFKDGKVTPAIGTTCWNKTLMIDLDSTQGFGTVTVDGDTYHCGKMN